MMFRKTKKVTKNIKLWIDKQIKSFTQHMFSGHKMGRYRES